MFYLTTHSTHFIYGYMASDIWLRTILIVRKETCCRHIGYSYRLAARVLLYAPSHRQDNTYHSLCYTSRGALAGTRNACNSVVLLTDDDENDDICTEELIEDLQRQVDMMQASLQGRYLHDTTTEGTNKHVTSIGQWVLSFQSSCLSVFSFTTSEHQISFATCLIFLANTQHIFVTCWFCG